MGETGLVDEKYLEEKGIEEGDPIEVIGHDKTLGIGYSLGFTSKGNLTVYEIGVPGPYSDGKIGFIHTAIKDIIKLERVD